MFVRHLLAYMKNAMFCWMAGATSSLHSD